MGDRGSPMTSRGGHASCMLHLSTLDATRIDEVEKDVAGLAGVLGTGVDYLHGTIRIEYDPGLTSVDTIRTRTRLAWDGPKGD